MHNTQKTNTHTPAHNSHRLHTMLLLLLLFGYRFTLRDASGKAVKLSDLGVAAFEGLTHLDAPFGRIT